MRVVTLLFSRFCIPVILLVSVWVSSNLRLNEQGRKYAIASDGKGYYGYLPAAFIYQDFHFEFFDTIEAKYYDEHVKYDYRTRVDGIIIDKYFAGVAVMQLPFFLAGHVVTLMSDEPADGYSKWYVIFFCLGAIVWLGIGLHYLRKFLALHGATDGQSAFLLYVIYFGTNLFYYTLLEPAMSHLYSFVLVSMFLYFGKSWLTSGSKTEALKCAAVFGLIALVRPVNILIGFWLIYEAGGIMPLFGKKIELLKSIPHAILTLVVILFPFFIQMSVWKLQTGNWLIDSYGEEGFHFFQPHMIDFLFSYKKGLFVFLPITFIALFGFIPLWRRNLAKAIMAATFLVFIIYVLSCWWMWYYGGSFGSRVMIEYFPVFALLLFYLVSVPMKPAMKMSIIAIIVILTLFCQLQTYQYRYELIHWSEMTQEKYWAVFGRLP